MRAPLTPARIQALDRRAAAIREAGHVVIGRHLGIGPVWGEIFPLVGFFVDVEMGKHKSCRAPAHTAIRYILLGLDPTALEVCVANALRICAAEGHRDMFCDSHFRSPGIEMAPGDTTVGSRPA
jgi:hypothetical protein